MHLSLTWIVVIFIAGLVGLFGVTAFLDLYTDGRRKP